MPSVFRGPWYRMLPVPFLALGHLSGAAQTSTQYAHDPLGRITRTVTTDLGSTSYGYDAAGNLVNKSTAGSIITPVQDTFVSIARVSAPTWEAQNFGRLPYIWTVGEQFTDWGAGRGLIKIDHRAIRSDATNIRLRLLLESIDRDYGAQIDVHRVTTPWNHLEVTWNTKPSFDPIVTSSVSIPSNASFTWYEWNITSLVKGWQSGAFANHGLVLVNKPENGGGLRNFHSLDAPEVRNRPYIDDGGFPPAISGTWAGSAFQSNISQNWTVRAVLGASAASIEYPSLGCAGTLSLYSKSSAQVVYAQRITSGSCVDNTYVEFSIAGSTNAVTFSEYFSAASGGIGQLAATGALQRQ